MGQYCRADGIRDANLAQGAGDQGNVLVALFLKGTPAFRTDLFPKRQEGLDSGVS